MSANFFNPASPELVVQNYFNLVQAIASRIKRRLPAHVDVEDLVQTGMIGLLEASGRYDVSRAVDFSSYATSRITGAMLDELRKLDPCSRRDRKTAREIEQAKLRLQAAAGTEPGKDEIARAVGLGLAEYDRLLHRLESSKQPAIQPEDSGTNDDLSGLPSPGENPFEVCSKRENRRLLKSYIARLKPRHQQILRMYYFEDMGLKQIGERLGVGEARISQIHKQIIAELRQIIDSGRRTPAPAVSSMIQ